MIAGWMGGPPSEQVPNVFVVRPDGSDERQLSDDRDLGRPPARWAPTAPLLAWLGDKGLVVSDLARGTERVVVPPASDVAQAILAFAWGPCSDRLAVATPTAVRIYNLAGKQLAEWRGPKERPGRFWTSLDWSSRGRLAVLQNWHSVGVGLYAVWVTADSEKLSGWKCLRPDWTIINLGWSPDGKTLLLGGEDRIWLANAELGNLRPLHPRATQSEYGARISPDGKLVAFLTGLWGTPQGVYVVVSALDGSWQKDVTPTDSRVYDLALTWSPDSTRVAFTTLFYPGAVARIYAADLKADSTKRLLASDSDSWPVWSPAY
jgi:WD40 repeat protein